MESVVGRNLISSASDLQKNPYSDLHSKQRFFFDSGATRPVEFRVEQLKRLLNAINAHEQDILQALNDDLGKPAPEAYTTEVSILKSEINFVLKNLKKWSKPKKVPTSLAIGVGDCRVEPHPKGCVFIISPFNYPIHLALMPLIGVIAAGNCAVIKPSELTPSSSELLSSIIGTFFDPSFVSVVQGGVDTTQHLLSLKWDHIFFTGSVRVGKIVASAAARFLTPVTLELGGKNPCYVSSNANIKIAARRIVFGKFLNAGQTCIAPDYLLVDESIYGKLVNQIKKEIALRYGNDARQCPDYGRIINKRHLDRLVQFLRSGKSKVIVGGKEDIGALYLSPSIVEVDSVDHPLMEEEIFGPILPILRVKSVQEAESIIENFSSPLACYYFGEDIQKARAFLDRVPSGGAAINDTIMQITSHHLPFGGIGDSGMGSYHGARSFQEFSHYKSVVATSTKIDLPVRYVPSRAWKQKLVRLILG